MVLPDLETTIPVGVKRKRTKPLWKRARKLHASTVCSNQEYCRYSCIKFHTGKTQKAACFYLYLSCKRQQGVKMESSNQEIRNRVNLREIYRYLGYGTKIPDNNIQN